MTKPIRDRIEHIGRTKLGLSAAAARELGFHMADWHDELRDFVRFCDDPEGMPPAEAKGMLMRFLLHVPNHVAAAGKLATGYGVEDIFEVGAVETPQSRRSRRRSATRKRRAPR